MNLDISGVEIFGYQSRLLRSKKKKTFPGKTLLPGPGNRDVPGGSQALEKLIIRFSAMRKLRWQPSCEQNVLTAVL